MRISVQLIVVQILIVKLKNIIHHVMTNCQLVTKQFRVAVFMRGSQVLKHISETLANDRQMQLDKRAWRPAGIFQTTSLKLNPTLTVKDPRDSNAPS